MVVIADGASAGAIGMAWAADASPRIPTAAAKVARSFIGSSPALSGYLMRFAVNGT
jgi:hypothetical protein